MRDREDAASRLSRARGRPVSSSGDRSSHFALLSVGFGIFDAIEKPPNKRHLPCVDRLEKTSNTADLLLAIRSDKSSDCLRFSFRAVRDT